jgi:spore germination cell wall hydrolase CwlJ-like protein
MLISQFDEAIAIRTGYMEARGESDEGRRAQMHCMLNRLKDGRWGKTLASVCLWPLQFSCCNSNDPNRKIIATLPDNDQTLMKFREYLEDAVSGEPDPTDGATHYYATSMTEPPFWAVDKPYKQIGKHRFLKGIK